MQNVQIIVIIVVIVNVFYGPLFANEAGLTEVIAVLDEPQKSLEIHPSDGCQQSNSLEAVEKDDDKISQSTGVAPIYLLRKDYKMNYGLRLKNDIFATPTSMLRYGTFIVFDQGETHGTEVDFGIKLQNDHRISYLYETNLYTQRSRSPLFWQLLLVFFKSIPLSKIISCHMIT